MMVDGHPPLVLYRCEKKGVAEKGICKRLKTKTKEIEGSEFPNAEVTRKRIEADRLRRGLNFGVPGNLRWLT